MTLNSAIQDFISHCKYEKNLSPKTIKAYKTDLNQALLFLKDVQNNVSEILKTHLKEYLVCISGFKPKTIKRKIASLKALFNYLEFEDLIIVNPFRKMQIKIKEPVVLREVMDINEVIKIFKKIYYKKTKIVNKNSYPYWELVRNIVVLELLFNTGARVSEIANLKECDLNIKSGYLVIKGKGDKERSIQMCNKESLEILSEYYDLFKKSIKKSGGWFLINRFHRKLSDQSIRNMVRKIAKEARITKKITPHVFRHTFATLLLEKDVDLKYIQSFLGHSSIVTTQIYTHVNRRKQRKILLAKHPRQDFYMNSKPVS